MSRLKEKARALKQDIPALFLALKDRRTPWYAKALAALAVGYALSPIDLIPDIIPVLGYLDDLLLLPLLAFLAIKSIPKDVLSECREKGESLWKEGKPKNWLCALPVLVVYALLLVLVLKLLLPRQ
ncbi:MAG: DUF1232 domain-containing protein [Spirochaetales bacterium]|nr:DUF1232 domain-containing protein [Candidatus Physcosoma equi]